MRRPLRVCVAASGLAWLFACEGTKPPPDAGPVTPGDGGADGAPPVDASLRLDGCTPSGQVSTRTKLLTSNNGAELTGIALLGAYAGSPVRKKVEVRLGGTPMPDFEFGDAYAIKPVPTRDTSVIVMPVRNVGTQFHCLIQLSPYKVMDATGREVERDTLGYAFVMGAVGSVDEEFSASCLGPGDTGYVRDYVIGTAGSDAFAAIAALEFSVKQPSAGQPAPGGLVATSYDVPACSAGAEVAVMLEGTGSAAIELREKDMADVFLFDGGGLPIAIDSLRLTGERGSVSPGQTITTSMGGLNFSGRAERMHVFTEFDRRFGVATRIVAGPPRATDVARARWRAAEARATARRRLAAVP